jgi:hypothetical protein
MKPEEFSKFLEEIDIAVFAINRQAAVGIITTLISLGKKVYFKKGVVPYDFYEENGIKIYDTNCIKEKSFNEFIEMEEILRTENIKKINEIYSNENIINLWRNIFDS